MSSQASLPFEGILHKIQVQELVRKWLLEDTPNFDIAGSIFSDGESSAVLLGKSPGVLAGIPFFNAVFKELDCTVEWKLGEGEEITPIKELAFIRGKTKDVLIGERVALNCLSRASGIATVSRDLVDLVKKFKWSGSIAGTRKTTPGFRMVEKYALIVGGAAPHRYDLSSMIMLKDNHIRAVGDIEQAVSRCRALSGFAYKIEVECGDEAEAMEAAAAGADVVMLDNFHSMDAKQVSSKMKEIYPQVIIEISGSINKDNIVDYLSPSIDVISMGALTHGYPVADYSLKIVSDP